MYNLFVSRYRSLEEVDDGDGNEHSEFGVHITYEGTCPKRSMIVVFYSSAFEYGGFG